MLGDPTAEYRWTLLRRRIGVQLAVSTPFLQPCVMCDSRKVGDGTRSVWVDHLGDERLFFRILEDQIRGSKPLQ